MSLYTAFVCYKEYLFLWQRSIFRNTVEWRPGSGNLCNTNFMYSFEWQQFSMFMLLMWGKKALHLKLHIWGNHRKQGTHWPGIKVISRLSFQTKKILDGEQGNNSSIYSLVKFKCSLKIILYQNSPMNSIMLVKIHLF